jgi:hypothetical protein
MTPVPVFLGTVVALTLINGWLSARIGKLRGRFKVSVGDGGHEPLLRAMRAQANLIETAPFFLFLVLGLELAHVNSIALAIAAALFVLARVSHGIGMEGGEKARWRMYGMMGTSLLTIVLIAWALFCLVRSFV